MTSKGTWLIKPPDCQFERLTLAKILTCLRSGFGAVSSCLALGVFTDLIWTDLLWPCFRKGGGVYISLPGSLLQAAQADIKLYHVRRGFRASQDLARHLQEQRRGRTPHCSYRARHPRCVRANVHIKRKRHMRQGPFQVYIALRSGLNHDGLVYGVCSVPSFIHMYFKSLILIP